MTQNCPLDITPLKQSSSLKFPTVEHTNYTSQDFWSYKSRIIDRISESYGNKFSDFVESDLALMLLENWAFIADLLSFKIDQNANEIFSDTVTELDNMVRLARLVGFEATPPIAGRSFWTASMNNVLETDLVVDYVPAIEISVNGVSSQVELFPRDSNNNPLFDESIIIPAGATTATNIIGVEGRTIVENNSGTGDINQTITLSRSPVLLDSIRVSVDGVNWSRVKSFTDSERRREFRVEYNANYEAFIFFGNNRSGLIPSTGSPIQITYRVGGGPIGNITTGSLQEQRQIPVPGQAFSATVTFFNQTRGEFGFSGDTIDDIRRKLPAYLSTQDRAVSGNDYKTLADQFATPFHGQIGKSTAVLRNHGCAGNIIDLYILARNGDNGLTGASNELKNDLIEEFENKKMFTDFICIRDGVTIEVDTAIEVVMDKFFRKFEQEYRVRIENAVNSFYQLHKWDYNMDLKEIDLIKDISNIKEVNSFNINFTTDDESNSGSTVSTRFFEIIRPDITTISFVFE